MEAWKPENQALFLKILLDNMAYRIVKAFFFKNKSLPFLGGSRLVMVLFWLINGLDIYRNKI